MKHDTILVIEDDEVSRAMLVNAFEDEYRVIEASNGKEGIAKLRENLSSIAVVLLDYMMPVMDGFQVLELLSEKNFLTKVPFIMITSESNPEFEKKGYEYGVISYIKKPYDFDVVKQVVHNVVGLFQYKKKLEILAKNQMKQLKKQNQVLKKQADKLQEMTRVLIESMSNIVEFRNLESQYHIKRIREFTICLGKSVMKLYPEYELTDEKLETIGWASSLHDIGKIVIPDNIILKSGKLTPDEYGVIKSHTTKGAEIIEKLAQIDDKEFIDYAYDIARHHHERHDGKGYPDNLKEEEISIAAQLVSLVDVYDALTSKRVYKAAYDGEKAFQMITNGQCGVFNPRLLQAFTEVKSDFEKLVEEYADDDFV